MRIILPRNFNLCNVKEIANQSISQSRIPKSEEITFDFSELNFIEPAGITALSNIIEFLLKNESKVRFIVDRARAAFGGSCIRYLDDANFFQHYLNYKLDNNSFIRRTTIALEKISIESSFEWIEYTLLPWLKRQIGLGRKVKLESFRICMMEIFNNISDHSSEHIACLYAQHYPRQKEIKIAVSDFGVGIPTNVRKVMRVDYDSYAIRKSVEEGFSSKSIPTNRGSGLDILMKNIVINNNGNLTILSNKGSVIFYKDLALQNNLGYSESNTDLSEYPGTLIQLVINTDQFLGDEEEEEFSW